MNHEVWSNICICNLWKHLHILCAVKMFMVQTIVIKKVISSIFYVKKKLNNLEYPHSKKA